MSQLHLIQNRLSFAEFDLQYNRLINQGDPVLFLNDSIYSLLEKDFLSQEFKRLTTTTEIYLIEEQVIARNISELCAGFKLIDYADFVELSINASKVVSW